MRRCALRSREDVAASPPKSLPRRPLHRPPRRRVPRRPADDGVGDPDREEVCAPVASSVGRELHVPALVRHAIDDEAEAGLKGRAINLGQCHGGVWAPLGIPLVNTLLGRPTFWMRHETQKIHKSEYPKHSGCQRPPTYKWSYPGSPQRPPTYKSSCPGSPDPFSGSPDHVSDRPGSEANI